MRRPEGHPIVAALLDWTMKPMVGIRQRVVPHARGKVLEVGVGTGLNLEHYDAGGVDELVGIEPDPHMLSRARARSEAAPFPFELVQGSAEQMPFEDAVFDEILLTFTLCTIPDAEASVREMFRVLRPGGVLRFAEHTRSDHRAMSGVQRMLDPLWCRLAGGCHLDRDAVELIETGGFEVTELHGHGRGPMGLTPVHRGLALRPG